MNYAQFMQEIRNIVDMFMPILVIPISISISIFIGNMIVSFTRDTFQVPDIDLELKRKAKEHDYGEIEHPDYSEVMGFTDEGEMIFKDKQ